jgi:hypothetical protein
VAKAEVAAAVPAKKEKKPKGSSSSSYEYYDTSDSSKGGGKDSGEPPAQKPPPSGDGASMKRSSSLGKPSAKKAAASTSSARGSAEDTFKWDDEGKGLVGPALKKDKERIKKWEKMFRNWETFRKTKTKAVLDLRVMKGIPDAVRGHAWLYTVHGESVEIDMKKSGNSPDKRQKRYNHYLKKGEREIPDPLAIRRLDPRDRDTDGLVKLLRAYLNADTEVTYSPLMGYVASILLGYMPTHLAYYTYLVLMTSTKHKAHNYFKDSEVQEITRVWDVLLQQHLPNIGQKFLQLSVDHKDYFPHWLQTAFLDVPCLPAIRLRIFDRFVKFGTRALFSFGLVVVTLATPSLNPLSRKEEMVSVLMNPAGEGRLADFQAVMKMYDDLFLNKKKFTALLSSAKCNLRVP